MNTYEKNLVSRRTFAKWMGAGALALSVPVNYAWAAKDDNVPFSITHGPVVQSPGAGEVTVTWHTNRPAVSRVAYGYDGNLEHSAVASRNGLIPNDSTCHAVRLAGLMPGKPFQYRLVSKEFKGYLTPYEVRFGQEIESNLFTCTPLDSSKNTFSFVMWNDIHDDSPRLKAMFDDISWDNVDFVVLNGDIINDFKREEQFFNAFYDVCSERFGARIPLVFVRGNHETRGAMARRIMEHIPGREDRPYYSFDHGNVHFVALDSGEDKPDGNKEYAGLVDFAPFREKETQWLKADLESDASRNARYRIILSHIPISGVGSSCFGAEEVQRLWRPLVNAADAQLWLSGHTHSFAWKKPREDGDNVFHAMTNPTDATVKVDVTPENLQVTVIQKGGRVLHREIIPLSKV